MDQLKLFEAAFSVVGPCPARYTLAVGWFSSRDRRSSYWISSWIKSLLRAILNQINPHPPKKLGVPKELFRPPRTPSLPLAQLFKLIPASGLGKKMPQGSALTSSRDGSSHTARAGAGAPAPRPAGGTRQARGVSASRDHSRGHLIFCTGF